MNYRRASYGMMLNIFESVLNENLCQRLTIFII